MLVTLCKISGVYFCLLAANDFRVKTKNGSFTSTGSRCRKKLKYENLTSLFCRKVTEVKNCTKKRAARLFFYIQPRKSLICGFVAAAADVNY